MEGGRRFHQEQRQHLQDVILDDVADRAGGVVEAAARADAERLGHRDLHVVDPGPVPDRLEDRVREAQGQEVLHGVLGQVVVDPEDLRLAERRADVGVQAAGAGLVPAEGLLDHQPRPVPRPADVQRRPAQLDGDGAEQARRRGQVEDVLAFGAERAVAVGEDLGEAVVGVRVVVAAADVAEAGLCLCLCVFAGEALAGPLLVAHGGAGHADQGELGPEPVMGGELADGGQELALGQVTGRAEDDQGAGRGAPGRVVVRRFVHRSIIQLIYPR